MAEVDDEIKNEIKRLDNKSRLVKSFNVIEAKETKNSTGERSWRIQIYIPDEERFVWGGFRSLLESQLISAKVCRPEMNPKQESSWKRLCSILYQFNTKAEIDEVLFKDTRNSTLRGLVDALESKLPLSVYLACKQAIKDLGPDSFEKDFLWYFSEENLTEDYWRGLEDG